MGHEQLEQRELGSGERDQPLATSHLTSPRIQLEIREAQWTGLAESDGRGASDQRPHPSAQLLDGERLDQIVVRASIKPIDAIGNKVSRSEHQDGSHVTPSA